MAKRPHQATLPGFEPPEPPPDLAAPDSSDGPVEPLVVRPDRATEPPESLEGQAVWAIDGHSLIYQVFHALPEMSSPRGEPVGAVYGFARDVLGMMTEQQPDYLFCAFDMPGKTFRHEMYEEYKIQRPAMPDDLVPQIMSIQRLLQTLRVVALGVEGYEADDVLATLARIVEERGGECVLVTSDKDCRQLISDRVKLFNLRKGQMYDREKLREDWGITPEQVVDFQALVGDSSDNVPGVPLVGPKAARDLLEQFGTLDAVLEKAGEVKQKKRRENLIEFRDQALVSRELVRLERNVPVPVDWEAGRRGPIDRAAALELFEYWGFRGIARLVDALPTDSSEPRPAPKAAFESKYHTVATPAAFDAFLAELKKQKRFSLDTETRLIADVGSNVVWPRWAEIVGYSFAWNDDEAWYVPVKAPEGEPHLDPDETLEALRPVLEDPAVGKIGQNLKYDMIVLRSAGVKLAGLEFDTMLADYLLEAGRRGHGLDELANRYLGHSTVKISELIGTGKKQKRMDQVSVEDITRYAAEDALLPLRLREVLEARLKDAGLEKLYTTLELPLVEVLAELEYRGIRVDPDRLAELSRRFGERLASVQQQIYDLAGHELNIASPKQLQVVLFDELGLPVIKRTKTGPSTDAEVLEELAAVHPLPAKIVEFRQYAKLKSTYVDALPAMIHPETGRVHTALNQVVAATGRLSSSDPNLQNIPVRTAEGREIRSAFVPGEPGWRLLAADYSQIELRVLAHFSGDEQLCESFARDEDIHARVASQVSGVKLDEVTGPMRRQAKAVNFGVIYGQSPFGLAKSLGISKDDAGRFIDGYFEQYPGIVKFLDQVLDECHRNGYVVTVSGRRRTIQGVRSPADRQDGAGRSRNLAERTAINTVIQGSAADLIKLAMLAIHARLDSENLAASMLLQVHDELIFEVPSDEQPALGRLVAEEMSGVAELAVPLKVDIKAGANWSEAEPVDVTS